VNNVPIEGKLKAQKKALIEKKKKLTGKPIDTP
jgi:hypothetical protein